MAEQLEKLTTSKLADKLGILGTALYDRLISRGYLELKDGKRHLTEKGKNVGGEFRMGNGPSFLWPPDLQV
jgi:Mn-dependent DtxR family transcriptional regulator